MLFSPMLGKRREYEEDNTNMALETSQLMIRSPPSHHQQDGYHGANSHKRPRYEPSWTLENLCNHPCSPLASIEMEVNPVVSLAFDEHTLIQTNFIVCFQHVYL